MQSNYVANYLYSINNFKYNIGLLEHTFNNRVKFSMTVYSIEAVEAIEESSKVKSFKFISSIVLLTKENKTDKSTIHSIQKKRTYSKNLK